MNVMHGYCDIKARVVRREVTKGVRRGSGGAGTVRGTKSVQDKQLDKEAHKHQINIEQSATVMFE